MILEVELIINQLWRKPQESKQFKLSRTKQNIWSVNLAREVKRNKELITNAG